MTRFNTAGLWVGALMLSSLGLAIAQVPSIANASSTSTFSKASISTDAADSIELNMGGIDSESPVPIVEGEGGEFAYQIWQNSQVSDYYLFIWDSESVPSQDAIRVMGHTIVPATIEEPLVSYNFDSAAEAVDFFTCRYARERLESCVMVMSSVSYDVPETCAFPWVDCKEP